MFFFCSPLLSLLSLLSQLCLLSLQCLLSLFLLPFLSQLFQITLASLTSLILLLTLQPLSYQSYLSHLSLYHWYLTHLSHITLATLSQISNPILSNIAEPQKYIIVSISYYPPFNVNNDLYLYTWSITFANKVTTRWEGPQSLSYHKQSLGNKKRWASVCTLMFNQILTSNQSYGDLPPLCVGPL